MQPIDHNSPLDSEIDVQPSKDRCPIWADELIVQLRQVEIYLGHIPKTLAWKSEHLSEVAERVFAKSDQIFDDHKSEWIYNKIVRRLNEELFSPEDITEFINSRIGYTGGPAYTSVTEVNAVLKPN